MAFQVPQKVLRCPEILLHGAEPCSSNKFIAIFIREEVSVVNHPKTSALSAQLPNIYIIMLEQNTVHQYLNWP